MSLLLHKYLGSAPSRAVLMTIEILELDIPMVDVNTAAGENMKQAYRQKNHLQTVPMLEDGDLIIADSHVIMTYLLQKFKPDSDLYSKDLKLKSNIDQRLYFESTLMTPKIISAVEFLRKEPQLDDEEKEGFEKIYGFLDKFLEKSKYMAGDRLTLADLSCVASLGSLHLMVPIKEKYTKLLEWYHRLEEEPWCQKINEPGVEMFAQFLDDIGIMRFAYKFVVDS